MPENTEQVPGFDSTGLPIVGAVFKWKADDAKFFDITLKDNVRIKEVDTSLGKALLCFADGENKGKLLPAFSDACPWYDIKFLKMTRYWAFQPTNSPAPKQVKREESNNPYALKPVEFTPIIRMSYTVMEALGRAYEAEGKLNFAKHSYAEANKRSKLDRAIDVEEKALNAGKVLFEEDYNKLSKTDKLAWDLKNLQQGVHYVYQIGPFLFWE